MPGMIKRKQQIVHSDRNTSAAQPLKLQPGEFPTPFSKGKSVQPILDSAKEHLLVTMEFHGHPAKRVMD